MTRPAACLLLSLVLFVSTTSAKPAKVYLFPTLHSLHRENPQYSYDSLRAAISRTGAEVIAVELRQEDLDEDTAYLRLNYPYEMWMMPSWYPGVKIAGFDWLGEDIAGRTIPAGYWKELAPIKKLERELHADSPAVAGIAICDTSLQERMRLLKSLSLPRLANSAYGDLTERYYDCLQDKLRHTRYRFIPDFYERRNRAIIQNCLAIIRSNPGKTIVILTGADHFPYLKRALCREGLEPGPLQ